MAVPLQSWREDYEALGSSQGKEQLHIVASNATFTLRALLALTIKMLGTGSQAILNQFQQIA